MIFKKFDTMKKTFIIKMSFSIADIHFSKGLKNALKIIKTNFLLTLLKNGLNKEEQEIS